MADIAEIGFKVDTSQLEKANRELDKMGRSGRRIAVEVGAGAQRAQSGIAGLIRGIGILNIGLAGAAFAGIAGFKKLRTEILQAGEAMTLQRRLLDQLTGSAAKTTSVMNDLVKLSTSNRQTIDSSVSVYQRFRIATGELGTTHEELLSSISGLQKALVLGGVSAQEAAGGMLQLSQGLASGRLQGDELRSVLETMPQVARAIAVEVGVSFGELRKAAADGLVGAEHVIKALQQMDKVLDISKSVKTLSEANTELANSWQGVAGKAFIAAGGVSDTTDAMGDLSKALADPGFQNILEATVGFFDRIGAAAVNAVTQIVGALSELGKVKSALDASEQQTRRLGMQAAKERLALAQNLPGASTRNIPVQLPPVTVKPITTTPFFGEQGLSQFGRGAFGPGYEPPKKDKPPKIDESAIKAADKLREQAEKAADAYAMQRKELELISQAYAANAINSEKDLERAEAVASATIARIEAEKQFAPLGAAFAKEQGKLAYESTLAIYEQTAALERLGETSAAHRELNLESASIEREIANQKATNAALLAGYTTEQMTALERELEIKTKIAEMQATGEYSPEALAKFQELLELKDQGIGKNAEILKQLRDQEASANAVGNAFGVAFGDALEGSENLKRSIINLAAEIANMILVSQGLERGSGSGIGGLFGTLFKAGLSILSGAVGGAANGPGTANSFDDAFSSYVPSANGNAFYNGSIIPFANGGIVNGPTLFPMANGAGLMGEAGPEAVMPLTRGADGKLGVQGGGGGTVNVNIYNESNNEVETRQDGPDIAVFIRSTVSKDIAQGGPIYKSLKSSFDSNRKLNSR